MSTQTQYVPAAPIGTAHVRIDRSSNGWKVAALILVGALVLAIGGGVLLATQKATAHRQATLAAIHAQTVEAGLRVDLKDAAARYETKSNEADAQRNLAAAAQRHADAATSAGAACYRTANFFAGSGWASLHDVRECVRFYKPGAVNA